MLPSFLTIGDSSRTSEARSTVRRLARSLDFDEASAERAAIVVTETCTNLLKHAGGGTLYLFANVADQSIEMLALDRGSGMQNWQECLTDGYSTSGTAGNGLGAIARLSSFVSAYSHGAGTALVAIISKHAGEKLPAPRIGGIQSPKPGQDVCGDAWASKAYDSGIVLLVADGLGHGPDAAAASRCAVEIFLKHAPASPKEVLESVHLGLRHTRGAAVTVASLDQEKRVAVVAGLGNVAGCLCEAGGVKRQVVTMNGTAGMESRTLFREFSYPWPQDACFVLHSDGLTNHWDLAKYPGLVSRASALIAGVLFRDHSRGNDDATVVVAT